MVSLLILYFACCFGLNTVPQMAWTSSDFTSNPPPNQPNHFIHNISPPRHPTIASAFVTIAPSKVSMWPEAAGFWNSSRRIPEAIT
jgi:hypothetical protein